MRTIASLLGQLAALIGLVVLPAGALAGCDTEDGDNGDGTADRSDDDASTEMDLATFPETCDVALILTVDGGSTATMGPTDSVTLAVTARDLSGEGATLRIADRCPNGDISFSGLGGEGSFFDYYQTCTAGACMDGLPPSEYVVPADGEVEVASTAARGAGCNEALTAGTYEVSFAQPTPEGDPAPELCTGEPVTVVVD